MKKNLFLLVFLLWVVACQAQMELKINPLGIILSNTNVSADLGLSKRISIEPSVGFNYNNAFIVDNFNTTGRSYGLNTKYYFKPQKGSDRFYMGLYARGEQTDFTGKNSYSGFSYSRKVAAIGYSLGFKWVTKRNVVFDIGVGMGRRLLYTQTVPTSTTKAPSYIEVRTIENPYLDGYFRFGLGYRLRGSGQKSK
jgi:Protein of unknown function (DUF3575)